MGVALLALLAATGGGCRRRRVARAPVERDPRVAMATRCADPRFVTAPAVGPAARGRAPAVAALGEHRALAASADDGAWLAVDGARVPLPGRAPGAAAVVPAGEGFAVAWAAEGDGVRLATVATDGRVATAPAVVAPAPATAPRLAWSGATIALAYEAGGRAYVAQLRRDGARRGAPVALEAGARSPDVAWARSRFAVAWAAGEGAASALRFATLAPGAAATSRAVAVVRPGATVRGVRAAWGGRRVALAWSDEHTRAEALYSTAVDLAGRRADEPQRLSIRYEAGAAPALAWDGGAFGIAWWEPVGGGAPRSYLAFLGRDGRRIGTQMRVYTDTGARDAALAWAGRGYLYAFARDDGAVELRYTGPRGCDVGP